MGAVAPPSMYRPYRTGKDVDYFASQLKGLIKSRGVTRREIANYVGVQESTVGRWALGKGLPREGEYIEKLAEFFNVDTSYFLIKNEMKVQKELFLAANLTFRERSLIMAYRAAPEAGKEKIESVAMNYINMDAEMWQH